MADYCKQCSIELFDEDFRELAGLVTKEQFESPDKLVAFVICEGCGFITVNHEGECVDPNCEQHGKEVSCDTTSP